MNGLTREYRDLIDYVILIVDGTSIDWLTIRKLLISLSSPKDRSNFARRHHSSKLPQICEFDHLVISYWEEKTGTSLFIDEQKLHPTATWNKNPKGWGIRKFNSERHERTTTKNSQQDHS